MTMAETCFLVVLFLPLLLAFGRMIPVFQAGSILIICVATLTWLLTKVGTMSDFDLGSLFVTWQILLTAWAASAEPAPEEWVYD